MDYKNVVKTTIYLTNLKDFQKVNEVYGACFRENPPARETVEVKALPKGAHVEISVIAAQ
jgi:2-iminobutanoate/2-iminopropanoate deaminase